MDLEIIVVIESQDVELELLLAFITKVRHLI
nr:MAG TPA: hypothetical protein [Caudoviricetes sp.]